MINNADRVRGCVYGVGALLMLISGTACAQYATTVQTVTGPVADWPAATIAAAAPNKIVGGGARTNWTTFGNLLTQSSPGLPGQNAWVGAGKDHSVAEPTTLTVFGIALNDPNDDWDVGVFTANSGMSPRPVVTAYLPDGFALTGGGCTVNWQASAPAPAGNLLTGSFPSSLKSWECRSKDHSVADPSTITAYVIGIRPKRAGLALPAVQITTATTGPTARPYVIVPGIPGAVVTGGGALALPADPADAGQLLTGTYPATAAGFAGPLGWFASSKDHTAVSPGTVTAFAVNLSFAGPGTALALTSSGSPQALWPLSVIGAGTFQNPNSVPVALTAVGFDGIGPGQRMVSVDPATTCLTTAPLPPGGVCQVVLDLPPSSCKTENYKARAYVRTAAGTSYDAYIARASSAPTCPY
jgi:hypothetical protein